MLITVPLSPRLSRLANPLAAPDVFLSMTHLMLLGMTRADDRSHKTERLGTVLRRVAGKLAAERNLAGGRELHPPESGEDSATRRPEKKGVAQTRDQGGRGETPRLGENVIRFAPCLGHGAGETSGTLPCAHRSSPDFNSSSAASYRVRQSRLLSRRRRAFFSPLKTVV
jgi:hypothetical protein